MLQNFRYALRALAKQPLYAGISIAVLAIAIGANATVFSVLNAFLLRPLPYPDGDRLVLVYDSYPKIGVDVAGTSIPDYLERRAQAGSLEDLAIVATNPRTLTGEGPPEQAAIARAGRGSPGSMCPPPRRRSWGTSRRPARADHRPDTAMDAAGTRLAR